MKKLQQRDEELEVSQIQMEELERELSEERQRNAVLLQQVEENVSHGRDYSQSHVDSIVSHDNNDDNIQQQNNGGNSSVELHAKIEECQRELQAFGLEIGLNDNQNDDDDNVPREINTSQQDDEYNHLLPMHHAVTTSTSSAAVDLAQSLIQMLKEESLSNEEENAIWEKLAILSEQLGNDDLHYDKEYTHQTAPSSCMVVPIQLYQRMQHKCHSLEMERADLKHEFLEMMQSTRIANTLQLQIMISEVQEEAQRQVTSVVNGKRQGLDLNAIGAMACND